MVMINLRPIEISAYAGDSQQRYEWEPLGTDRDQPSPETSISSLKENDLEKNRPAILSGYGVAALLVTMSVTMFVTMSGWAFSQGRSFPPSPPLVSPIAGAIDMHVHSSPDVFGRSLNDFEVARIAARAGMRALVLKNHVTSTADRAKLITDLVPGIEAVGGIVLNRAVGGINPDAVEWMFRMEGGRGRIVWLPSFDADHHLKTFGQPGEGLKVAIDGRVTPAMDAVLKIIAREDLVLATCHVSPGETLTVIKRARELGINRIVVTHAMAEVPGLDMAQLKEAASMGAYLEYVYLSHLTGPNAHQAWMRHWRNVSIADFAGYVREIGASHFVLGSDLGQTANPIHTDGYKRLVTGLVAEGISQADVDLMMKTNPAELLGLD